MLKDALKSLQAFFDSADADQDLPESREVSYAVAALLVEVMIADHETDASEQAVLEQVLKDLFPFTADELEHLMARVQKDAEESNDMYRFTRQVNDHFTYEQRIMLVKGLWQMAFADGQLDKYEEYTLRKISDLLYIRHKDFLQAKLAVKKND